MPTETSILEVRYDEDLVEAVVLLVAHQMPKGVSSLQVARFHRARERLYNILDPEERNDAFFRLHREWFREWGLEAQLLDRVAEYPLLDTHLGLLAFRKALTRKDQGAELYVNPEADTPAGASAAGRRHGVVALSPPQWLDLESLKAFLRHELMHLQDMVDPAFGYRPDVDDRVALAHRRRLVGERYRVLWDITIDGRLVRAGRATGATEAEHRALFDAAFSFWDEATRARLFRELWSDPHPRHGTLLRLAADPQGLWDAPRPAPGAPCPLCSMPTYAWSAREQVTPPILEAIRREFPDWTPEHGLCNRCLEAYEVRLRHAQAGLW